MAKLTLKIEYECTAHTDLELIANMDDQATLTEHLDLYKAFLIALGYQVTGLESI